MRRNIARLALVGLAVAIALAAVAAYAYYKQQWWPYTAPDGTSLQQGVAIQVNMNGGPTSSGTIWGSTVTWASRVLYEEYAQVAGGESCDGFPTVYFNNYVYGFSQSSVQRTGSSSFPARPCQSSRQFNVHGWSSWWDSFSISHDHVLQYRP
jgi:hypothetical protein